MFFREKNGRNGRVIQLVESYRNEEGQPRQRVVASLGDAALPQAERGAIAKAVELRLRREETLLPVILSAGAAAWVVRIVKIAEQARSLPLGSGTTRVDGVILERVRTDDVVGFGPHLIGCRAWDALGLSDILEKQGMTPERIALARLMTVSDPDNNDRRLVLCRSAQRREKEHAMISRAEERFLEDGKALRKRIEAGRLKKTDVIERKIGALLKKHPRVARYYSAEHKNGTLQLIRNDEKLDEALALCGDYVLKTDKAMEASTLWELYMTLLEAEKGFQLLKGTLGLRPNYHQLEHRVDGHIFISVLAYHPLRWIGYRLETAGDPREWRTLRRLLSTHVVATTRLPLADGREISIRKPSEPDEEQQHIYTQLGIDWKRAYPARKTEVTP